MPVLLIAESSDYLRQAMQNALSDDCDVHTAADGFTALDLLDRLRPDALIIDLSLNYLDGLQVLQQSKFVPSVVMALCPFISYSVLLALQEAGCTYVMRMPCTVRAVAEQLRNQLTAPLRIAGTQARIDHLLKELDVPAHLSGYQMLALAIEIYAQDTSQSLSKEIYPKVAELLEDNFARSAIEHNIRRCIKTAWQHRENVLWRKYFPKEKLPTNKLFIATVAKFL
jgi:CheY-like chemotaxis protein